MTFAINTTIYWFIVFRAHPARCTTVLIKLNVLLFPVSICTVRVLGPIRSRLHEIAAVYAHVNDDMHGVTHRKDSLSSKADHPRMRAFSHAWSLPIT